MGTPDASASANKASSAAGGSSCASFAAASARGESDCDNEILLSGDSKPATTIQAKPLTQSMRHALFTFFFSHLPPAEADDRALPGHWEGDLIIGKNQASQIGTLVERSTGFVRLLHLPDTRSADVVADAMIAAIKELPPTLRRTVTWDQGHEMAQHARISIDAGIEVYFCDPHSPWQRGSNENTNGLLRQYFPKGTDLSVHSPEHLAYVADELNADPENDSTGTTPPTESTNYYCHHRQSPLSQANLETARCRRASVDFAFSPPGGPRTSPLDAPNGRERCWSRRRSPRCCREWRPG